ncbi:MAG: hypothetical protein KAU16_09145 [Methanophagales archaeon]|nr:hypothetical protein [Methanophagales archaeon]
MRRAKFIQNIYPVDEKPPLQNRTLHPVWLVTGCDEARGMGYELYSTINLDCY